LITDLNHITLAVSNLERSFRFYVEVLGCQPRARWNAGAYLNAGSLWLCLSVDKSVPAGDYTHFAFSVDENSFSDAVKALKEAGARSWKSNTSEGDSWYFLDPDNHKLELHCGSLESRLASVSAVPYEGWQRYD